MDQKQNEKVKQVKYKGVRKRGSGFQAFITINRKQNILGVFKTSKEAAEAYDLATIQAGRSTTKLNFPPQRNKIEDEVRYIGVKKLGKRYQASIRIDGKPQNIGTFDTPKEAAEAHNHAAIQAGHATFQMNFPEEVPENYNPKKKKLASTNTTGFRGVYKQGKKFKAATRAGGKNRHIGMFDTPKEAAIAFDLSAIVNKRPIVDLNFPDNVKNKSSMKNNKKMMKSKSSSSKNSMTTTTVGKSKFSKVLRKSSL